MQFLESSLLELITQTSTNLPPDVRAAMAVAMKQETARHSGVSGDEHHRDQYRHGAGR